MQSKLVAMAAAVAAFVPGCLALEDAHENSAGSNALASGVCGGAATPTSPGTPTPPSTRTRLAEENQTFTVPATTVVEYGAGTAWVTKSVTGSATCSNAFFGTDPAPFVVKACYAVTAAPVPPPPPTRTRVAAEGESFDVASGTVVEYGAGSAWVTKTVSGSATCSNAFFGTDPAPFVVKACYVLADAAPTPTPTPGQANAASLSVAGNRVTVTACRGVQTAAGVYRPDGTLVRTLWRRIKLGAGQETSMVWDYQDDFGRTVGDGTYEVKVIAHNVAYKWEGVIGNSSNRGSAAIVRAEIEMGGARTTVDTVGEHIHRAIRPISSMAIAPSGQGFLAVGYAEQQPAMHRFDVANPQSRTSLSHDDFQRVFELVTTDGNLAYFANTGLYGEGDLFHRPENFIVAFRANDGGDYTFPRGSAWDIGVGWQNRWPSVVDPVADGVDRIRGLAVETNGPNLYVAHEKSGIKILDKTTGACRVPAGGSACGSSIAVPSPTALALAPNGDLWVIASGREVRKYVNPGTAPALALTISGFSAASAIAISPLTSTLVVADAGDQQQLKAYDTRTGAGVWVHGTKGGYSPANGPDVTPQKLFLSESGSEASPTYLAFEPARNGEETLWVGEPGNYRNLKLRVPAGARGQSPLVYVDQILYIPTAYNASIDKADPTRVFSQFLEFKVDYAKPLPDAWTLTKNWSIGLPRSFTTGLVNGPRDVQTAPDGRTYAFLSAHRFDWYNDVYELTASGLRSTGVSFPYGARLHENMSVRFARRSGGSYQIVQRDYSGADASGNPTYGQERVVASAPERNPRGLTNPYISNCANGAQEPVFPKTSTDVIITFDPCANPGYDPNILHLGGIKVGGSDYAFRSSPGGAFKLAGNGNAAPIVDGDGTFNLERLEQNYAGSVAMAAGRHVIYNYFGEYWNSGQANQWVHWLDNGLFLGQFGMPTYPQINRTVAVAGAAGNTFAPLMVEVGSDIFVYHNDESVHAGVHRWKIEGLPSIEQMAGQVGRNTTVSNPSAIASTPIGP